MNEVIIHQRIALLCSFPLRFIIQSCLHPFLSTPLVEDELTVCVSGQHKSLSRGAIPTLQCSLYSSEQSLLACGICCGSLGNIHWVGLVWWGVRSGVPDTSLRTAVIWGTVLSVSLVTLLYTEYPLPDLGCRGLCGKGGTVAEYWWQQE